jgi:hypothetical protein
MNNMTIHMTTMLVVVYMRGHMLRMMFWFMMLRVANVAAVGVMLHMFRHFNSP